jgi:lipoprotein signal peptidase
MPSADDRRLFFGSALGVFVLDVGTKVLAEMHLLRSAGISVAGEWFQLRLVYNPGPRSGSTSENTPGGSSWGSRSSR